MVTIKMIAKQCGYSVATVSKALNNAPDVSAETAERIRKTASEMGYTPNSAARLLKTSRSYSFGVLFEDASNRGLTHVFFSKILNSFKHRAEELGYDICFISARMGGREISYSEHARYRGCDGIIIASVDFTDHAVMDLANSGIPIVTIDHAFSDCGCVASDNLKGIEDLVRYIYSKGHRKIAFIHGEDTTVTRHRVASFCRTCRELGVEIPEGYLVPSVYTSPDTAAEHTKRLLSLPDPPTCIIYPDDISYIGGMNQIEKMGLRIPEDISTAGYDGADVSQMLRPRLTTVRQDADRMGELAADELLRAVEEGRSYVPGRILVPGELIPGQTVKNLDL